MSCEEKTGVDKTIWGDGVIGTKRANGGTKRCRKPITNMYSPGDAGTIQENACPPGGGGEVAMAGSQNCGW